MCVCVPWCMVSPWKIPADTLSPPPTTHRVSGTDSIRCAHIQSHPPGCRGHCASFGAKATVCRRRCHPVELTSQAGFHVLLMEKSRPLVKIRVMA